MSITRTTFDPAPQQEVEDHAASIAIMQMVRALARRQARLDARVPEAANDNRRPQ